MIEELRSTALSSSLAPRHIISETTRISSTNISEYSKNPTKSKYALSFSNKCPNLIIPNEFKNTFRRKPFAVGDILSESGKRTVIFASRRNLNYFSQSSRIYFDATFKTVPQFFSQLFTVHAMNFTTTVPCVYALMQRKTKAAHDTAWDSILRIINLNCNHAICDFELTSINSFNQRNPLYELTGCFFHLSQYM
ncbi:hypothetical protein HZS_3013 [Henneguya salminicola]|nr:hypothetical protein HZS_3013 [Henneguya salminicola]